MWEHKSYLYLIEKSNKNVNVTVCECVKAI